MSVLKIAKQMGIQNNVQINVLNPDGTIAASHEGHNAATNSLLLGIGHYLLGEGVLNQGYDMLSRYIPRYISLGTTGLIHQECDSKGLPTGVGTINYTGLRYMDLTDDQLKLLGNRQPSSTPVSSQDVLSLRYADYMMQNPGYGADGYDLGSNNNRRYMGLGPMYANRPDKKHTINCELISDNFPRTEISFRQMMPETQSELPQTIDIIYSAMISTGALAPFREPGKDYIFITEAGLWSERTWLDGGENGLLAGYRLIPPDRENWYVVPSTRTPASVAGQNRELLRKNIIRVNRNQVVQVIWKIQIGSMAQLGGLSNMYR